MRCCWGERRARGCAGARVRFKGETWSERLLSGKAQSPADPRRPGLRLDTEERQTGRPCRQDLIAEKQLAPPVVKPNTSSRLLLLVARAQAKVRKSTMGCGSSDPAVMPSLTRFSSPLTLTDPTDGTGPHFVSMPQQDRQHAMRTTPLFRPRSLNHCCATMAAPSKQARYDADTSASASGEVLFLGCSSCG